MTLQRALRSVAMAIALAAVADPVFTRQVSRVEPLTVVATEESAWARASAVRDALSALDATLSLHDSTSSAAACPSTGACVIVSSGDVPRHVSAGSRILAVVDARGQASDKRLVQRIDAASPVHRDTSATIRVHTSQPAKRIDVFDGNVLVGAIDSAGETVTDVTWVPVETGARALRVVVDGETAHAGVVVESAARSVMFYEPQASWLGTFVRRVLEDDPRFDVRGRTRIAPPVAITRGGAGPLTLATLEQVGTIVVTAPEMLSASEVDMLETFVAERGGSLLVLADERPSGASLRLLPRVVAERHEPQARTVGALRTTEWLTFAPAVGVMTIAAIDEQPVIVARAFGRGRVVVSGALDAWRYRQANDGFAAFWTSLAWDAATAAGSLLRVETDQVIARPGEEVVVTAEGQADATAAAEGAIDCGDDRSFLRLWPGPRPGTFRGSLRVNREAECLISVTVDGVTGTTPVTFRDDLQRLPSEDGQLDALAAAHNAALVTDANRDELRTQVREQLASQHESVPVRPMRSPWWLLPFALCLGGEWWLRRQSGLS
jgi:hypothetical protein